MLSSGSIETVPCSGGSMMRRTSRTALSLSRSFASTTATTPVSSGVDTKSSPASGGSFTSMTVIAMVAVSHRLVSSQTSYTIVSGPL